ncbi:MAG TPA: 1-acyl-sn-glycerol-3-phosphate acyltransferase [Clostridiaceae bacterium]|nr:1-acyl-sn-glycerol-3-phosphate acyltransferase [Clostridiaceae bacterium]
MISKEFARIISCLPKPIVKWFIEKLVDRYMSHADITVVNKEALDRIKGPVIFISNHLSNSDGLVLDKVLGKDKVWFLAGVKLAKNEITKLGLGIVKTVPINPNSPDRSAISAMVKLLKSGQSVCIFPEGTRSRSGSLIKGKKGILLIARMTNVPMVPIGIEGTEKLMPINDTDMGGEKFYDAKVKVSIGKSFYLPERKENEDKKEYENRALYFAMRKIAVLLSPDYQGIYREQ